MDATTIVFTVAALLIGAALGWFARSAQQTGSIAQAQAQSTQLREERDRLHDMYQDAVQHAREEQRAREGSASQHAAVLTALSPVQESLRQMQTTVAKLEHERHTQFGAVTEQLRRANEADQALRETTQSLVGALRSSSTRGVWGETQLRRVVEAAGLLRHVDFDEQVTVQSDTGAGRPDMIVRLAGGTTIAVDAKVPLDAFLNAQAADATADESARRTALLLHARAVRAHVDALAKRSYWSALTDSPEFVVCFMPTDALLASALEQDPTLLDHAFSKRVALATPVNLWALLKTVAHAWKQQEVSSEAQHLLSLGTQLYERLTVVAKHGDDLRRAIERTVDSYNRFAGSLERRVLVTARKFPGIHHDDSALQLDPITTTPTRWSAEEFLDGPDAHHGPGAQEGRGVQDAHPQDAQPHDKPLHAELGDVRARAVPGE